MIPTCSGSSPTRSHWHRQIIEAVAVAPAGETWVRRGGPDGSGGPIDVFGADGGYLCSLPSDFPFPVVFLSDGRIGFSEIDSLDVERLIIARIDRG